MSRDQYSTSKCPAYFHPDDPAGWLKPDEPFVVDGLDWSWAFVYYKEPEGFPGYRIGSNGLFWTRLEHAFDRVLGRISIIVGTRWKLKTQAYNKSRKYYCAQLSSNAVRRNVRIHQLVMEVFVGLRPTGLKVLHWDDDRKNNRLSNVRYGTMQENHADAVRNGTMGPGEKAGRVILTEAKVVAIREEYATEGVMCRDLAEKYNVAVKTISAVISGQSWKHVGGPITKGKPRGTRKLNSFAVYQARELLAGGMTQREAARRFGVNVCTIRERLKETAPENKSCPQTSLVP